MLNLLIKLNLLIILIVAPTMHTYAAGNASVESRYQRTIKALNGAPAESRQQFASIALLLLADAYFFEAALARQNAVGDDQQKLFRWSKGVDRYATELLQLQNEITSGVPVQLMSSADLAVIIDIAGHSVMLTHPRPIQQALLEHQILKQFCEQNTCNNLIAADDQALDDDLAIHRQHLPSVTPSWELTLKGPVCTYNNIRIAFKPVIDFAKMRPWCKNLFEEVALLAHEIAWLQQQHVIVDQQKLQITATPQSSQYLILLNTMGDSLVLKTPILYRQPTIFAALRPWLTGEQSGSALTIKEEDIQWNATPLDQ
ncbi:MAG: hypothetical protein WCY88_02385 [Spongiibacteraceae bacterium]